MKEQEKRRKERICNETGWSEKVGNVGGGRDSKENEEKRIGGEVRTRTTRASIRSVLWPPPPPPPKKKMGGHWFSTNANHQPGANGGGSPPPFWHRKTEMGGGGQKYKNPRKRAFLTHFARNFL